MKPAACSWRVITSSIFEERSDSTTSRFSSPGMPKMRSTPSFSSAATRTSEPLVMALGLDQHGLDVDELADAEVGALAAVAGVLDAAERHARIGAHVVVDKAHAGIERIGRDPLAACEVAREHA